MSEIHFQHVFKTYQNGSVWAVEDITLTVPSRSLVVFLGPSGCGKTTLLKMVNRLYEPTKGRILINGTDISTIDPTKLRRRMGYSIQRTGLFPHMTVAKNIAVVPNLLGWEKDQISSRVQDLLELMHLPPETYLDRYPAQLSGGEQQRVGIARALAADPDIMLMDEPFGALDAITRTALQTEISQLQQKLKKTVLFVTHDVDEAIKLADYIAILQTGKLIQFGRPADLMRSPANDFVAQLLDSSDRVRQISLIELKEVMEPVPANGLTDIQTIQHTKTVRQALSMLLTPDIDALLVVEGQKPVGWVTLESIRRSGYAQ